MTTTRRTASINEDANKKIEELASWEEVSVRLPKSGAEGPLEAQVARRGTDPNGRPLVRVVFRTARGGSVHIFAVDPETELGEVVRMAANHRMD